MPELSRGVFQIFRRVDGAKFWAHLTSASSVSMKEKAPYRILHCRTPSFVKAGDVILSNGGEVIILMEQPDDFDWATSFKAVYALEKLIWLRQTTIIDPVSHVKKDLGFQDMGKIYVNFDTAEEVRFEGLLDTKYRFITGQDVRINDRVGDYTVKRIVQTLGVKLVFAT